MGGQRHAPAALPPEKTRYPIYRRLGGPRGGYVRVRKFSSPTGIRSPDRPARSESLYRLSYPGTRTCERITNTILWKSKLFCGFQTTPKLPSPVYVQGDSLARGPKEVYLQIFNETVNQLTDDELTTGYYQQDGATCHTSNASMREIYSFLKNRIISKNFWAPRSPNLTPADFFL